MARRSEKRVGLFLAGLCLAGAGGCTNLASFETGALPVADGSPVALAVRDAVRNPGPIPSFANVPKAAEDALNAPARAEAERLASAQVDAVRRQIAAMPPIDPAATTAFAARSRSIFAGQEPPTDAERAEAEAFARAARARATPPPPPR